MKKYFNVNYRRKKENYIRKNERGIIMKKYLLCLEKNYDVELGKDNGVIVSTLEGIIDNLVYLLQSYGVEEEEILEQFKEETDVVESEM